MVTAAARIFIRDPLFAGCLVAVCPADVRKCEFGIEVLHQSRAVVATAVDVRISHPLWEWLDLS
jgi:hypothetical protein